MAEEIDSDVETRPYRLLRGSHGRYEDGTLRVYKAKTERDVVMLTDGEVAGLADRVVPLPADSKESATSKDVDWISVLSERNVSQVGEIVAGLDDLDEVKSILVFEETGLNRKGAIHLINNRIKELESRGGIVQVKVE